MDYHATNRSEDGVIRMPVDGFAFRNIEERWPKFKEEPHNIMLSLAADGVNPFGELRYTYSVWLIFTINYNILPWISIKRKHIILTMIVPSVNLFKIKKN